MTALPESDRRAELAARLAGILDSPGLAGCVVLGAPGLGKSTLADQIVARLAPEPPVHRIHGSATLRDVDFGAVVLMLGGGGTDRALPMPEAISRLSTMLSGDREGEGADPERPDQVRQGPAAQPLVVVEHAEHLDMSTCFALGQLVQGRSIRLLMLGGMPGRRTLERLEPVLGTRLLELVVLQPMSRDELAALAATLLGLPATPGTIEGLDALSGGIPALAAACLHAAERLGTLVRNTSYAALGSFDVAEDPELQSMVRSMHEEWDRQVGEALLLLSLAGAQPAERILELTGAEEDDLLGTCLVVNDQGTLRTTAASYADVLRHTVPPGSSRALWLRWARGGAGGRGLRETVWALNAGASIEPGQLERAAREANDDGEPMLALQLCTGSFAERTFSTALEEIRATTALGRHLHSQDAVAELVLEASDPSQLERASASWWGVLLASGPEPQSLGEAADHIEASSRRTGMTDGTATCVRGMRVHADVLAGEAPEDLGSCTDALAGTGNPDLILGAAHIIVESGRACAREMSAVAEAFVAACRDGARTGMPGTEDAVVAMVLELDMLGLDALGLRVLEAFGPGPAALHPARHDQILFIRGFQRLRQGYFATGCRDVRMASAGLKLTGSPGLRLLAQHLSDDDAPAATAHQPASPGILRRTDELVIASRSGGAALAELAAKLRGEGRGLQEMEVILEALKQDQLEAMGDQAATARLAELAVDLEGEWGAAVRLLAAAWNGGDPQAWVTAAAAAETAGYPGLALLAWCRYVVTRGATVPDPHRGTALKRLHVLRRELGAESVALVRRAMSLGDLTKREEEILELAVEGLSNREIARRLTLSQRTVEGHLYRIFVKLGIEGRAELIHFT